VESEGQGKDFLPGASGERKKKLTLLSADGRLIEKGKLRRERRDYLSTKPVTKSIKRKYRQEGERL